MKIKKTMAVYTSTKYDWYGYSVFEHTPNRDDDPDFIRVSEPMEIEFELFNVDFTSKKINAAQEKIEDLERQLEAKKLELAALRGPK